MIRDITVGQYYNVDSVLHELDPRVKIRFVLFYIILLLLDRNLPLFAMLTVVMIAAYILGKVPFRYMFKGMRGVYLFIILCSLINVFTTRGTQIVSIGSLVITEEGFIKAGFVLWRMVLLIIMASLQMYTTTPSQLTDGFEKCFHMPGKLAMSITIALRFIPILFGEMKTIMKAQEARGAEFNKGGIYTRIKTLKSVLIPLINNSILKAVNLGYAMDSRCYTGGKGRTKLHPLKYRKCDGIAYLVMFVMIFVGIVLVVKF